MCGCADRLRAGLDRLGRSLLHLVTLGAALREREVGLHVIEQGNRTATQSGHRRVDPHRNDGWR